MKKLLPIQPDAFLSPVTRWRLAQCALCSEAGLEVPHDVAIVGYDDSPIAGRIFPGLTTIHQPTYEMGYSTFELLLKAINNPIKQIYQVLIEYGNRYSVILWGNECRTRGGDVEIALINNVSCDDWPIVLRVKPNIS
jgi:DNA-binding LacI/PurR family transcriptional regulator